MIFILFFVLLLPETTSQQFLGTDDNDGVSMELMGRRDEKKETNFEHFAIPASLNSRLRWMNHRARARQFVLNGQLEQAKLSYKALLHTKANSLRQRSLADLHLELGHVCFLLDDTSQARTHFETAQSYRPQAYQPFVRLAQLDASLGHIEQAKTQLLRMPKTTGLEKAVDRQEPIELSTHNEQSASSKGKRK